jgi:hypothetical protein
LPETIGIKAFFGIRSFYVLYHILIMRFIETSCDILEKVPPKRGWPPSRQP